MATVRKDSNETYLGSSALVIHGVQDVITLETIACRAALSLTENLLLRNFMIAIDTKQVARDIQKGSRGSHGQIIAEIKLRALNFICNFLLRGKHRIAKPIRWPNFLIR